MALLKFFVISIVFIVSLIACRHNKVEDRTISLSDPKTTSISLKNIAENVTYLNLSSEIPIQHIHHFEETDEYIFISCHPEMILKFDKLGNLLGQIGKKGRGPNEYERTLSFAIDNLNKYVIVLANNFILKFYNFSGKYIESINLKDISDFSKVNYLGDNKLLLTRGNPYGNAKFNWIIIDTDGKIIETKKNHVRFDLSTFIALNPSQITCKSKNNIYYYESFNDTIFCINDGSYFPQYVFKQDEYRMTPLRYISEAPQWINKEDLTRLNKPHNKYFNLRTFFMTKRYFWIGYSLDFYSQLALVDNKTNELYAVSNSGKSGLFNDFDGGLPFFPNSYFESNKSEFFVSWIYAFKLKSHVASETFKNSTPKYPEKKKELEKLANSLDENDNPVLMLVKLKE